MRQNLERRFEQQQQQGIDLSPLLDVVFMLLIFFIVTTVFVRESGVDVNKPQAVSTQELERNVIIIAITHHGEVMYDSNNIGVVGVRSTISQLIRQQSKPVVIQADKRVSTDLLVKVLDQAKIAGADHVSIATTGQ